MSTVVTRASEPPKQSRIDWREKALLAAIAVLFLAVAIRSALLRPFWFDELSTFFISSIPTLKEMFEAIHADGNPLMYFLLARITLHLPLPTELALRLPSILAFSVAASTVYFFVRRSAGGIFALAAMGMFLGTAVVQYGIEARSYALLLCFTGLALCCWQIACCRASRGPALAGIVASTAGAVLTNHYGLIYALAPIFAAEAVRTWRRRRVDWDVLLCCALGAVASLLTLPPMLRRQHELLSTIRFSPVFFAHPHLTDLSGYSVMLPHFSLILVVLAVVAVVALQAVSPLSPAHDDHQGTPVEDFAAAVTLALFLPLMLTITHFGTGYFQLRYAVGSAMGIGLVAGLTLSRVAARWPKVRHVARAVAAYSLAAGLLSLMTAATPSGMVSKLLRHPPDAPEAIVVADAAQFTPAWWYASPPLRARMHYLTDHRFAGKQIDFIPEFSLALERDYLPMRLDDYQQFIADHPRFLLYCYSMPMLEWTKDRLVGDGWTLTLLQKDGEQELYQATAPGQPFSESTQR
ncbi:MAG: glycosyltransferase family 39 protein [Silvibacterium sp.]